MFPYSILTWEKENCLLTFYKKDYYFAYLSYTNWNIFILFWYICFSLLSYHFLTSNNCHFVSILIIFIIMLQILWTIGMRYFSFIYLLLFLILIWFWFLSFSSQVLLEYLQFSKVLPMREPINKVLIERALPLEFRVFLVWKQAFIFSHELIGFYSLRRKLSFGWSKLH